MSAIASATAYLSGFPGLVEDVFVIGNPDSPSPFVIVRLAPGRALADDAASAVLLCQTASMNAGLALDYCVVDFAAFTDAEHPSDCADRRTAWTLEAGRLVPTLSRLAPGALAGALTRIHPLS